MVRCLSAAAAVLLLVGLNGVAMAMEPAACTFDIWPAQELETNSDGGLLIRPHNDALKEKDGAPSPLVGQLSPAAQRKVIARLDLLTMFNLTNAKIVVHDMPAPADRGAVQVSLVGGCRAAELVLQHLVFTHTQLAPSLLQGIFTYRTFASDGSFARSFTTMVAVTMPQYTAARKSSSPLAPLFDDALAQDVEQFARYAAAPQRKNR